MCSGTVAAVYFEGMSKCRLNAKDDSMQVLLFAYGKCCTCCPWRGLWQVLSACTSNL